MRQVTGADCITHRAAVATGPLTASMNATAAAITKPDQRQQAAEAGAAFPNRAALVDFVDPVHRSAERADVSRCGPQRDELHWLPAQNRPRAYRRAAGSALTQTCPPPTTGTTSEGDLHNRLRGAPALAEDAEQRHHHEKRGKQRQHRVVRQRSCKIGALIVLELAHRPAQHVEHRRLGQFGWRVWLTRIVGIGPRLFPVGFGTGHTLRYPAASSPNLTNSEPHLTCGDPKYAIPGVLTSCCGGIYRF